MTPSAPNLEKLEKMFLAQGVASMQMNSPEMLPKTLPGVVCPQWVQCGRPGCRCSRGELHGPYFYRFWREGGRLRKAYVKASELDEVRARCKARQQFRRELQAAWSDWRQLAAFLKETEET
jgi:hypothetical protein